MSINFLQDTKSELLVEVVDSTMKPVCCMPYAEVYKQNITYIHLVGIFIYNDAVLLSKTFTGQWTVTVQSPLLYNHVGEDILEKAMALEIGIKGVRAKTLITEKPSLMQPYFLILYTISIPYSLHTSWNMHQRGFVESSLLKQSISLEPKAFTPLLIRSMDYL